MPAEVGDLRRLAQFVACFHRLHADNVVQGLRVLAHVLWPDLYDDVTVVFEAPFRPGDTTALRSALDPQAVRDTAPLTTASAKPVSAQAIVELLTRHGLADRILDLGATRFAHALAGAGCITALELLQYLVCRPRTGEAVPPQMDNSSSTERSEEKYVDAAGQRCAMRPKPESVDGVVPL